jgi:hypothetical protein
MTQITGVDPSKIVHHDIARAYTSFDGGLPIQGSNTIKICGEGVLMA